MTLASGSRLGPYRVFAPLGADGMGEVCRIGFWVPDLETQRPSHGSFGSNHRTSMPRVFADRARAASAVASRKPSDATIAR
jgi:hypothetical protein